MTSLMDGHIQMVLTPMHSQLDATARRMDGPGRVLGMGTAVALRIGCKGNNSEPFLCGNVGI